MSAKKALQLLKDAATELVGLEKEDIVKFAQETLDNDAIIEAEVFEAGQPIFIVNEEERVALPIGDYTLADGRKLVVTEEGIIGTIGEMEEETEEVDADADFVTKTEFNEAIDSIKAMFSKEKEQIIDKSKAELKKANDKAIALQKEIDEKPDANEIKVAPKQKVKLSKKLKGRANLYEWMNNKN